MTLLLLEKYAAGSKLAVWKTCNYSLWLTAAAQGGQVKVQGKELLTSCAH